MSDNQEDALLQPQQNTIPESRSRRTSAAQSTPSAHEIEDELESIGVSCFMNEDFSDYEDGESDSSEDLRHKMMSKMYTNFVPQVDCGHDPAQHAALRRLPTRIAATELWASVLPSLVSKDYSHSEKVTYLEKHKAPPKRTGILSATTSAASEPNGISPSLYHGYVGLQPSKELAMVFAVDPESVEAIRKIIGLLALRKEFMADFPERESPCVQPKFVPPESRGFESTEPSFDLGRVQFLPKIDAELEVILGVYHVYWKPGGLPDPASPPSDQGRKYPLLWRARPIPSVDRFLLSLKQTMNTVLNPACKTFCYRRLKYLRDKFSLHTMFNGSSEMLEVQENKHRDFYNVRKVDTHVHHSACMRQKHLLRFIRSKYRREPTTIVRMESGKLETLTAMFQRTLGLTAHELSVDRLNVHALGNCFHRFDIFNNKYNPFGQQDLREIFLKTDNYMGGRYLAEITQEVQSDLEDSKYQFVEWRISIYGKSEDEWESLGKWFKTHKMQSQQVRWLIQVPRLYAVYKKKGIIHSFGDLLRNVFGPVFRAIIDPESYPDVFVMLHQIVGWDSVDDESVMSKFSTESSCLPTPDEWTLEMSPPYSYWAYYMYANIRALNELLHARGMRTMPFRPHCGEAGNFSHLASMFLVANGINHGIMLRKIPVLQYAYYLKQIPVAVSPLSNNSLFHEITRSPFPEFFNVGMNVSLSTDDPLMFHFTDEPLLEEYSCCAHVWKLTTVDLCEIARNSVLQSNFEPMLKRHWIGEDCHLHGKAGNDISRTNVPNIRVQYREDTLREEFKLIRDAVVHIQELISTTTMALS